VQYWVRCFVGEAPELVIEAMDLSKIIAKHKYRSWYMKIHAIISKHGFGYIMDHLNETNCCSFLSEFGQQCEDRFCLPRK